MKLPAGVCAGRVASRLVALGTVTLVAEVYGEAHAGAGPSVSEIGDTLQNLLRSVTQEGDKVEGFFKSRRGWCDGVLESFEKADKASKQGMSLLGTDLKEHEASVEESQGTIQQVQADIVLVQHTLNQTQEMHRVLRQDEALVQSSDALVQEHDQLLLELVDNKRQTLQSLQGELDVIVPALSQLEARVVETKHRIADRMDSASSQQDFVAALRSSCDNASARRDTEATDRDGVAKSIQQALDALGQVGDLSKPRAQSPAAPDAAAPGREAQDTFLDPPNFVQLASESEAVTTEEDLLSIFSGKVRPGSELPAGFPRMRRQTPTPAPEAAVVSAIQQKNHRKLRPKIKQTLAQLRSKEKQGPDESEWCAEEHAQNELALRLAQASIGELTAEIDAHVEAETQVQEEIGQLNASIVAATQSAKETLNSTAKERELISAKLKDSALAVRILAQATAILVDLQASGALAGGAREQAAAQAKAALGSARVAFEAQGQTALKMRGGVAQAANELAKKSAEAVRTQKRERMNLESAFDSHVSLRSRLEESKRMHDTEVKQAATYLASLEEECKTNVNDLEDQERKAEMRALDDAQQVLAGKRMVLSGSHPTDKDGLVEHKQMPEELSPMERAAAEMGITVDSI